MAARLMSSVRFHAKSACCRARMARPCSCRGETQALTLVTLGTGEDVQEFDAYTGGDTEKKFILHYNFPNFSVGETGRNRRSGPARNRPRRARETFPRTMLRWEIIPTRSASRAKSWNRTAPLPWRPCAAVRSR